MVVHAAFMNHGDLRDSGGQISQHFIGVHAQICDYNIWFIVGEFVVQRREAVFENGFCFIGGVDGDSRRVKFGGQRIVTRETKNLCRDSERLKTLSEVQQENGASAERQSSGDQRNFELPVHAE